MTKAMTEIRGLDTPELQGMLHDLRKEQFQLRFRGSDEGAAMNTRNRDIRRTVARIMTVIGERDRAQTAQAAPKKAVGGGDKQ